MTRIGLALACAVLAGTLAWPAAAAASPRARETASVESHILLKGSITRVREGRKVARTRVGDTVLFALAARNDGPAAIPAGTMAFVITLSDALEGQVSVDKKNGIVKSCERRTTGFLCRLGKFGAKGVARVRLRLPVPDGLAGERISVRFKLGLVRDLPANLTAFQSPPTFVTLRDRVEELDQNTEEPAPGAEPLVLPAADACPASLRFVLASNSDVTQTGSRVFVPDPTNPFVFRCVYRGADQLDLFVVEIDATPPATPGALPAGDCDRTRTDEPNAERIVLYSRSRHLTVAGGFRIGGWFVQQGDGGATIHPATVLGQVLSDLEKNLVGAAC